MSAASFEKSNSLWNDAYLRLRRNRAAMISLIALTVIIVACVILPSISGLIQDPNLQNLPNKNLAPSRAHLFGTDYLGRDIFARVLVGGRISIAVGLVTTLVAVSVGICWGAVSGYAGGKIDSLMMRIVDVLYALPFLIIVILLSSVLEPISTFGI